MLEELIRDRRALPAMLNNLADSSMPTKLKKTLRLFLLIGDQKEPPSNIRHIRTTLSRIENHQMKSFGYCAP